MKKTLSSGRHLPKNSKISQGLTTELLKRLGRILGHFWPFSFSLRPLSLPKLNRLPIRFSYQAESYQRVAERQKHYDSQPLLLSGRDCLQITRFSYRAFEAPPGTGFPANYCAVVACRTRVPEANPRDRGFRLSCFGDPDPPWYGYGQFSHHLIERAICP